MWLFVGTLLGTLLVTCSKELPKGDMLKACELLLCCVAPAATAYAGPEGGCATV